MPEINTFSAAVDDVLIRSQRPSRSADAIAYVRQSLRECQMISTFDRDLTEDSVTATASPHIWTLPDKFRILRTLRYNIYTANHDYTYPPEKLPGKIQLDEIYYYYRAGNYFTLAGVESGTIIDVAYYSYFRKLPYYAVAARPATFDLETELWSYLTATTDAEKETARDLVTNWLLTDWYDLIMEGALAKMFKTVGDDRARSSFALYKSLQSDLKRGEPFSSLGQ